MIKLNQIVSVFTALILVSCSSDDNNNLPTFQNELDFISTYGGTKNESGNSIESTSDGGYIVLGYTQSMDGDITDKQNESFDYWITKFNNEGVLQWSKTYGGTNDDRGSDIIQTSDGGYAILGYTQSADEDISQNAGFQDYWIAKLNSQGEIEWENSYGFAGADNGSALIQTSDAGYMLVGVLDVTASGGQGNSARNSQRHAGGDYWAVKIDTSGNLQWSRYFGGSFSDSAYDVLETADGNYIIVGSSDSNDVDISANKGTYDYWVVKINNTGTLLWEKSFGGDQIDEARGITDTNDGNYLIVGTTRSEDQDISNALGAADFWIIKISPSGELLSEKTVGGSSFDSGLQITKSKNGGFIACGSTRSSNGDITTNNGQNDAWVFKVDENLNIEWSNTFGSSAIDVFYDVAELDNNHVVAVGESNAADFDIQENKGFTDLLITKLK